MGSDPAVEKAKRRKEGTIQEAVARYMLEDGAQHNKSRAAAEISRIMAARVLPAFGKHKVSAITRADVKAWHQALHATPYEANRALAYLSKLMSLCHRDWQLRPDNPCLGLRRFPEKRRERFFSDAELRQLGVALKNAEGALPESVLGAIRLLALIGCRLSEVLSLTWTQLVGISVAP